jgi:predicted alpha/beta-hydrolase family hydrolase
MLIEGRMTDFLFDGPATADATILLAHGAGGAMDSPAMTMLAATLAVAGLLCIGYPFHPVGKPEVLRTAHLAHLQTPTLIAQGTRDVFGARDEVAAYHLSNSIELLWIEDGDHDLKPRKSVTGCSQQDSFDTVAEHAVAFAQRIDLQPR